MMDELYAQFVLEAGDHLEQVTNRLLELGGASSPEVREEALGEALRCTHSLKGAARMVGVAAVVDLVSELENRLAGFRGKSRPSSESIDAALVLCDRIHRVVEVHDTEAGQPAARGPGALAGEPLLAAVQAALPTLPESIIESLTDFQCEDIIHLRREAMRFWLVRVDSGVSAFEEDADRAAAYLRERGQVLGQTAGVSAQPGYDYVSTFLFAGEAPPATTGHAFHLRCEELVSGSAPGALTAPRDGRQAAPAVTEEQVDRQLQDVFLGSADNLVEDLRQAIAGAERTPDSIEALDAVFRAGHSLKGAGSSFGFPVISGLGHEMEQVLDLVRRRRLRLTGEIMEVLYACADTLAVVIERARENRLDQSAPLDVLDRLRQIGGGDSQVEPVAQQTAPAPTPVAPPAMGHIIHLPVQTADRLLDLGRDAWLTAETAAFVSPADGPVREAVDRTRSSVLSLVDAILGARMQPVGQILKAYPRMVRDVCRRQAKRVRLDISGADVQMDRLTLEAINDPLMHLVRNGLDHGIEETAERVRAGKPAEGVLTIRASAARDTVTIEVADDGHGIDTDGLRRNAAEHGVLTSAAAATLTETQALDLMFLPGITTKDTVTDLSGRGVGMDVVRANIERLRGKIEVTTRRGVGTTVRLSLPLTAAMLRVVAVETAGVTMCLPTGAVERVVPVPPGRRDVELAGPGGTQEIIPLVPAARFVSRTSGDHAGQEAVILRDHGRAVGLVIDRVVDERPVLISDLGGLISRTRWVGACTLLANGHVAPILDAAAIVASSRDVASGGVPAAEPAAASAPPMILCVDDSPTMRQLLRNVLELAGYRVALAAGGSEALTMLAAATPDLALVDLNMPGMDGLVLVREIRRRWPSLPVAIVSGRDEESDRRAGLEAGAHAYIVKGATDRRGLLATVARLVTKGPRT